MNLLESRTVSVSISCDWKVLYERIWRPECFPQWASGLSEATLHQEGWLWTATGPTGTVSIRFTDHNDFGIMDHWVELADGQTVYVPLRVMANGEGTEVQLTLFRQPGMTNAKFKEDAEWVLRDPVKGGDGSSVNCEKLIPYGKGGWLGFDWFTDQPSLDACLKFCDRKQVNTESCPCNSIFKGAK